MEQIITAAAMLARTNPELWTNFTNALMLLADEAVSNFVASDSHALQTNQGRAQAYLLLSKTCHDAIQKQEEIEARRRHG